MPLYSEQSSSSPAAKRRLVPQHTCYILKYHPELSLLEFADNLHVETTMNKPFLPILHIFTLSLMLFVLTLMLGWAEAGGIGSLYSPLLINWWKVWLQLSAPSLLASNEAAHKCTHLHQRSAGWSSREVFFFQQQPRLVLMKAADTFSFFFLQRHHYQISVLHESMTSVSFSLPFLIRWWIWAAVVLLGEWNVPTIPFHRLSITNICLLMHFPRKKLRKLHFRDWSLLHQNSARPLRK